MRSRDILTTLALTATSASAFRCPPSGNVFPLPDNLPQAALDKISASIKKTIMSLSSDPATNITGFGGATISVELTTPSQLFFEFHHKGPLKANSTDTVDGASAYRIGSISKVFATLAMMLAAHDKKYDVDIDDSIVKYFPALGKGVREDGVQWEDVTLRMLASHTGGLPREAGHADFLSVFPPGTDFTAMGLPPVESIPKSDLMCGTGYRSKNCTTESQIEYMTKVDHSWAQPFDRHTYSNAGFSLLGQAMAKAYGKSFGDMMGEIFPKLNMTRSGIVPPNENGVNPEFEGDTLWGFPLETEDGAGGIYSTTNDLSAFIRGVMSASIFPQKVINKWLKPVSFASSLDMAVGMPWEIYRLANHTANRRVVDVYSKDGAVGAYTSFMFMLPDYGFGGSILSAGTNARELLGGIAKGVYSVLSAELEEAAREYTRETYAGTYTVTGNDKLNSSMVLSVKDGEPGIMVNSWISNGTDMVNSLKALVGSTEGDVDYRLFPMSRNDNPEKPSGTVQFRGLARSTTDQSPSENCIGSVDLAVYAGKSINEVKFKMEDGKVTGLELPAFRVTLVKSGTATTNATGNAKRYVSEPGAFGVVH